VKTDSAKSSGVWISWLPVIAWAGLLFGLSSIPGSRIPAIRIAYADKIAHMLLYGIFGLLCSFALRRTLSLPPVATVAAAAAIALSYGITDEIHQMFVPMRSSDLLDVAADVAGGSMGAVVGWLGSRLFRSPPPKPHDRPA
jgi:VanZ family protein